MTLRTGENILIWRRRLWILDLSSDRILNERGRKDDHWNSGLRANWPIPKRWHSFGRTQENHERVQFVYSATQLGVKSRNIPSIFRKFYGKSNETLCDSYKTANTIIHHFHLKHMPEVSEKFWDISSACLPTVCHSVYANIKPLATLPVNSFYIRDGSL